MNSTEIKERDRQYILGTYARNDLCIAKGSVATCWSPEDKKYIDFSSGIGVNSLGYCDEGWISAVHTAAADAAAYLEPFLYRTLWQARRNAG